MLFLVVHIRRELSLEVFLKGEKNREEKMGNKGNRKKKREYDLGGIMSEMVRGVGVENGVMG